MKSGDLKLEHGKKYVQYTGAIVGPILELSDGRFSWAPYVWDSTGKILANDGLTKNQSALCNISHEYVERKPDSPINPETGAEQYAHKEVGITMTLSPVALEAGKTYRVADGWNTKPLTSKDDEIFSCTDDAGYYYEWTKNGKNTKGSHGFGNGYSGHNIVKEIHKQEKPNPNQKKRMNAGLFLDAVKGIVAGPREKEYGDKTQSHQRIADLWNMWLNETKADSSDQITAYDVAMMMILVKIARLMNTPGHQDSHIDIAGYASILEEISNA